MGTPSTPHLSLHPHLPGLTPERPPLRRCPKGNASLDTCPLLTPPDEYSGHIPTLVARHDDIDRGFVYSKPSRTPLPPSNGYQRYTDHLTRSGARTMQGAALKGASLGLPLRTCLGLSIRDSEQHRFIPSGDSPPETTIGAEIRAFLYRMQKWCKRRGYDKPLHLWVAENPPSTTRPLNLHGYMLLTLTVRRRDWTDWCEWLLTAWPWGWTTHERIHHPEAAARYVLKAVQYSVKGTDAGQGRVWGRRWSVSAALRPAELRTPHDDSDDSALLLELLMSHSRDTGQTLRDGSFAVTPRGAFCDAKTALDLAAVRDALDRIYAAIQNEPF